MNFLVVNDKLRLDDLRYALIRSVLLLIQNTIGLEDTIIFSLIERAQFKQNLKIYETGAYHFLEQPAFQGSFLDWLLHETEKVHAKVRRYSSPDEYPFTDNLPDIVLPPLTYHSPLIPNKINENAAIKQVYTSDLIRKLCSLGDDENHGSAATIDIECLQALSKRIHYGKFIAEAKFQAEPQIYTDLIKAHKPDEIMKKLTNQDVEDKLLARLRKKALWYGQDLNDDSQDLNSSSKQRIDLDMVVSLYKDFVIPLTKKVEVSYLMARV